ncbi:hypothetical protein [Desulfonatronovibrio magnus]|uniref:hypothetical protein n=1 Tax=Desulfonatronovibrio magnus TaxID=698827 RepID=UPI0012F7D62B|nr:hypothetical protein [Desulfonatronovibrio magnus]
MGFFVDPEKVLEEFHMLKGIGDNGPPYEPKFYQYYKEHLTGRALEYIQRLELKE